VVVIMAWLCNCLQGCRSCGVEWVGGGWRRGEVGWCGGGVVITSGNHFVHKHVQYVHKIHILCLESCTMSIV